MVLLIPDNKTDDEYKQWGAKIGMPSELGVHLKVGISYSDCPGPPHVAYSDKDEHQFRANVNT